MQIDAVLAAGGDPSRDAELLAYAGNAPRKALIKLGEKTFLQLIVSALLGSERIRRVVVVGLPTGQELNLGPQVSFVPDAGSMLANGEAGLTYLRSTGEVSERIVACTSDIPLITPQVVSGLIDLSLPHDVDFCYPIVSQQVMERAFPGSGRTFVPIEGGRYAGGDIDLFKPAMFDGDRTKLDEIVGERKTFWKQLRAIGLITVFLFLMRRLTIARTEQQAMKVLGFTGKVVISPYAEVAMDVDKPHHFDIVRAAWERRQRDTAR